ncbi:MAG: DUF5660 family protein [Microgenomates group bacterium]
MVYNPKNKKKLVKQDSFLEALRDLGGGVIDSMAHDVVEGITQEAFNQITSRKTGELKPGQTLDVGQLAKTEEKLEKQTKKFTQEFLDIRQQERLVWVREKQDTRLQIAAILEELKKLASATKNLSTEVDIAAKQIPVEPGVYHISFFEKLRQTLTLLRKRIEESATWLATFNQKAKKRNYYWAQVRKSGTKFMLSQERYMATQAG